MSHRIACMFGMPRMQCASPVLICNPHSTCSYTMCVPSYIGQHTYTMHIVCSVLHVSVLNLYPYMWYTHHGICSQTYIQSYGSCPHHTIPVLCCINWPCMHMHALCASASMVCTSFGKEAPLYPFLVMHSAFSEIYSSFSLFSWVFCILCNN